MLWDRIVTKIVQFHTRARLRWTVLNHAVMHSSLMATHRIWWKFVGKMLRLLFFRTTRYIPLSLRFNGYFPGEPGLASVYWSKGWWRWWWQLDYWSYRPKSCKAPVRSSPPNQHPVFYRPDALPVAQTTVSMHWRENITFHGLAYPKLTWGLPT